MLLNSPYKVTMLLMGKLRISMAISNGYVTNYQRVSPIHIHMFLGSPMNHHKKNKTTTKHLKKNGEILAVARHFPMANSHSQRLRLPRLSTSLYSASSRGRSVAISAICSSRSRAIEVGGAPLKDSVQLVHISNKYGFFSMIYIYI